MDIATTKLWKDRDKLLTRLKERFQLWISYEVKLVHSVGLTPNQVSGIGVISAIISALLYWNSMANPSLLIAATIFLLTSGFCDAMDGALARIYGKTTVFGDFLDSILDRYVDTIVLGGIVLGELCHPFWGLAALIGSLLVSYVRARAEATGVKMETVGIAERAERLIITAVASLLSIIWLKALEWGIILIAVLTNLTVLQRVIYFRKSQVDS